MIESMPKDKSMFDLPSPKSLPSIASSLHDADRNTPQAIWPPYSLDPSIQQPQTVTFFMEGGNACGIHCTDALNFEFDGLEFRDDTVFKPDVTSIVIRLMVSDLCPLLLVNYICVRTILMDVSARSGRDTLLGPWKYRCGRSRSTTRASPAQDWQGT